MTSHYITEIEKKLKKLGIDPNADEVYNKIFEEKDANKFARKLRVYNEHLNKIIDANGG